MSSRQEPAVTWLSYNYPTSISAGSSSTAETVNFAYGPGRQRWQQAYSGNGTVEITDHVGGLLEVATASGVMDYRHYIYAGSEPVAIYSRKSTGVNTFSYLPSDHQGSIAAITNSSGAVVVAESNTPFATRRNPTTWSGAASNTDLITSAGITRQGYTFQTALGLWMGLNHMNGSAQDAVTGRFMSADPSGTSIGNTQSWNRYAYAVNNPLSLTDPSGFDSVNSDHRIPYNPFGSFGSLSASDVNFSSDLMGCYDQCAAAGDSGKVLLPEQEQQPKFAGKHRDRRNRWIPGAWHCRSCGYFEHRGFSGSGNCGSERWGGVAL
jgi:RHS repeat-associated protein